MKKIGYYIITLLVITTASCKTDFLDTKSPSKQTTDDITNSTFAAEAATRGLYSVLTESTVYGQKLSTNWPTCSDIEHPGLSTNNLVGNGDGVNSYYFSDKSNGNSTWDNIFRLAEMASTEVAALRISPLFKTSDSAIMKVHLGEALTLRSLAYFELLKCWGDIPFRKDSVTTYENASNPKCDRDTVYKFIIRDLLEAQNYLPWLGQTVGGIPFTAERVTKGFAKGLCAKVALFAGGWGLRDGNIFPYQMQSLEHNTTIPEMNGYFVGRVKNYKDYYAIAAQQCAEIIGDANNPHRLDVTFENVWKTVSGLQLNSANENLFETANGLFQNSDIGPLIGMNFGVNTKYCGPSQSLGGGNVKSTIYYFYSFNPNDQRRDISITNISYTSSGLSSPVEVNGKKSGEGEAFGNDPLSWNIAKWRAYWMSGSYFVNFKTATARLSTGINWIVMRYPDVLLMFAEAQNELAGADVVNTTAKMSAKSALQLVRDRAFKTTTGTILTGASTYDSNFFEAIVNERAWEFGGEAIRKYDLERWGLLSKKLEDSKKALCLLINGVSKDVTIFDRFYPAGTLPLKVYYKWYWDIVYQVARIDRSDANLMFYGTPATVPSSSVYKNTNWLQAAAGTGSNLSDKMVTILTEATGLDATYDYSQFTSQLNDVTGTFDMTGTVNQKLRGFPMIGNKVCNYRYFFAIYNTELQNSNNAIVNSYGY